MDHVIKTRAELRRGEARLNYSSSEILETSSITAEAVLSQLSVLST